MTDSRPTVYVVDDDQAVRKALRWLIESADLQVENFASAKDFLAQRFTEGPGCIVTDVRMPGINGLELQQTLAERGVHLPVIVITGHGDVEMAVRAMKADAFDFIEKPFSDERLLRIVQDAIATSERTLDELAQNAEYRHRLEQLTLRERQVLDLIVTGQPNKRVAFELGISEKTVEVHRAHIMEKMDATSFADLVTQVVTSSQA